MFESNTYENLLEDVLNNAPDDIDTRPGSIFYDAISGVLIKIAKLYTDLDLIFSLSQVDTAAEEYLDIKASEYGITRHAASKAKYTAVISGSVTEENERFFYNEMYFVLKIGENGRYFEAEEPGAAYNRIIAGTAAVPVDTIPGLNSAKFGQIIEYGFDAEDDDNLRRRLKNKISGTGENGNKQQYKLWCESVSGVGKAKILPLRNGPNTVKAILIDLNGLPCNDDIVAEVQQYVDPGGLGLGEGVAPIGAHFTAAAAESQLIDVYIAVEVAAGTDTSTSKINGKFKAAIKSYFKTLVMNNDDNAGAVIRYSEISTVIGNVVLENAEIIDYSELSINGSNKNITLNFESVPVLGVLEIETV